jgi:hypothetical protein
MKKITFILFCLLTTLTFSQVLTSGLVDVEHPSFPGVTINSVQIDIDVPNNLVTATIIGPDDSWLGFGFDTFSMTQDKDIILFDGTNLTDRIFDGLGNVPLLDSSQDWTIMNNTTSGGLRTLVGTRARDTGDSEDFVFPTNLTSLDIVTAHGANEFALNYHQFANRALERLNFTTLSVESNSIERFSLSPNPTVNNLNIVLPSTIKNTVITIYDILGKNIYNSKMVNTHTKSINVSSWQSGVYLVRLSNDTSVLTMRFVKQ